MHAALRVIAIADNSNNAYTPMDDLCKVVLFMMGFEHRANNPSFTRQCSRSAFFFVPWT